MVEPITIAITGDVMLGRLVDETIAQRGFAYPWGDMRPVLAQADLLLVNLECALTDRLSRWHDGYKEFYFKAAPAAVATLIAAGVDLASLANNHICDFGPEGLLDTLRALDAAGIAHAGAGAALDEARRPALLTSRGRRVAVVGFADYPKAWAASDASPGLNYTQVATDETAFAPVRAAIAEARAVADVVVFSVHWGPNMRARPTVAFREFARSVVRAGADVFWGHSAHVVQGIEFYETGVILYDTGDFVDDYAVDTFLRNDLSALFRVRFGAGRPERVELLPVQIGEMQVNAARGAARQWFIERVTELCNEMGTAIEAAPDGALVARPAWRAPE